MENIHIRQAESLQLAETAQFPNSAQPVLLYRSVVPADAHSAEAFESLFARNGWPPAWRDSIYDYHHYHSTAHECLGISRGQVRVQLGGPDGQAVNLAAGDVVVIPAGVAHRRLRSSADLEVIGAYPPGQSPDLLRGAPNERPHADNRIARLPVPATDPVQGAGGTLPKQWQTVPMDASDFTT
ncbi:MAG: cupin domain-containing protein [Alcaligenaceae bacterium]|nr:MAG: cupin domain-containing protein [Alcaligenaceae bacterium]